MKIVLVICTLLIGMVCYASGPVQKDCVTNSATVTQSKTLNPVMPALVFVMIDMYDLSFVLSIPELGMPIDPAELKGFSSGIWHPPVINSTLWLNSTNFSLNAASFSRLTSNCRSDKLMTEHLAGSSKFYPIAWYDIA